MNKPYAESCDQNRDPILAVIEPLLRERRSVLEIGSGTGQHAIYFGERMPHLQWHTSERRENHAGMRLWLDEAALANVHAPIELDVRHSPWPAMTVDAVFSANTAHIMHWADVEAMFAGIGGVLGSGGIFLLYGPFSFSGRHTSDSNAQFDLRLKGRDPLSGVRDFDDLDRLAQQAGLALRHNYEMPVNNRILFWQKR